MLTMLGINIMADSNTVETNLIELSEQLPEEIEGWKKSAERRRYGADDLFEYINGGAELYISYNFKQLAAIPYENTKKKGAQPIRLDIFDMGTTENAYGIFAHSRETVDRTVAENVESEYISGQLTFWKGRYYVSILAYPETEEKKKVMLTLARTIAEKVTEESRKPLILKRLPGKNLVTRSIRYFRHHNWINSHYFISDKNILYIDKETEAVLAKYIEGDSKFFLLLVQYPGNETAVAAEKSFLKNYLPGHKEGIEQLEDGRWTGIRREGKRIAVVLNASGLTRIKKLFQEIFRK